MTNGALTRAQLYTRLGFGLLVAFGMVGNCAGHREGSAIVFAVTAVGWVVVRIVQEATDAWQQLNGPQPPTPPRVPASSVPPASVQGPAPG